MVKLSVVTRVGDPERGLNMALTLPWIALDPNPIDVQPDYPLGKHVSAAPYLGPLALNLRAPVFTVGEILIIEANDRDTLVGSPASGTSTWSTSTPSRTPSSGPGRSRHERARAYLRVPRLRLARRAPR